MDCENIFNKKKNMPYIIQVHYLEFAYCHFFWRFGVGWKISEELPKSRGRNHLNKDLMILDVVFVVT